MRNLTALAVFAALAATALAQPPAKSAVNLKPAGQQTNPPVQLNPQANRLDALLLQWEQKMREVNSLQANVVRTETDAIEKTTKTYQGEAKFLRPDHASLFMRLTTDPTNTEHYIFTGTFLYQYFAKDKKVIINEIAPEPGKMVDDNFLNFLFGMKAIDAKRRYNLTLAGQDKNYVYLFVDPKLSTDRQDFTKARLALWAATYLPRELQFEMPNGSITKWDIPRIDPTAKLTTADFVPPRVGNDWQIKRMPRVTSPPAGANTVPPPSKVRPSGG